ncbi:zinc ribbon domain-containing protein [Ruminococcus albus]|uniref:zinc ribbon domain-containing protein n=1 Tax=Ruminococcus albus TaxID=1264 RepID=UPI000463D43D|nr:zinc ribbon domain-containing protein [Ruminococcus albus]
MALIKCPNCFNDVSNKATKCPRCGFAMQSISESDTILCEECNLAIPNGSEICPHCGCPAPNTNKPQKVEVVSVNVSKSHKKTIIIAVITAIIICGGVLTANIIHDKQEQIKVEQQEKEEKEKIAQAEETYQSDLESAVFLMLSGAADAESAGGLIHDVWSDTIYEERNTDTLKYTMKNGKFNDDFNDSLSSLFSDTSFKNKISNIESNQDSVKELMKKLTNPPDKYADAYDALKNYYDSYLELTELVTNPKGSLTSYTSSFNEADSSVLKYYQAMDMYLG